MTAPADIRTGLATALASLTGFNVVPYMLSAPVVETIHFFPDRPLTYDMAGSRGVDQWSWTVQAFVGLGIDVAMQQRLDELLASSGALSIKALLEADPSLGGVVMDLRVTEAQGHQFFSTQGRADLLGSTWKVLILAGG